MPIPEFFLIIVTILALVIASLWDIKTREIPNWLNYSLFAVGFSVKLFNALFANLWQNFFIVVLVIAAFFALSNLLYYTKQWGGGDAKMLIALAPIIAVYEKGNALTFLVNLLFVGALYGFLWTLVLAMKNRKRVLKEFSIINKTKGLKSLKLSALLLLPLIFLVKSSLLKISLLSIALYALSLAYFWAFIRAVENIEMYKTIPASKLTEGDWVVNEAITKKFHIPKSGVEQKQIKKILKSGIKKIIIKDGIPFAPSFLFAFLVSFFLGNVLFVF